MTNNWTDIGNATLVVAFGANPAENHPACMAHVNRARKPAGFTWKDGAGNSYTSAKNGAKLVVIDPRKTKTALQADMYVRIRPGTNIAFSNGLVNYILTTGLNKPEFAAMKANFTTYHTTTSTARKFVNDAGATITYAAAWPKYSDALFKVNAATPTNADYLREKKTVGADTFANMPVLGTLFESGTVLDELMKHVAPYTPDVVADICDCNASDISAVGDLLIAHSRIAGMNMDPKAADHEATTFLYAMGLTQHTTASAGIKGLAVVQTLLGNVGWAGGGINALRGIHNVQGSTDMGLLYGNIPAYSYNPAVGSSFGSYMDGLFGNRVGVKTPASLVIGTAGSGSEVTVTARWAGDAGNHVTVEFQDPGTANAALAVVQGATYYDIVVKLATDATGVITSTAQQVTDALNAKGAGSIYLTAVAGGTGVVAATATALDLAGGTTDYTKAYTYGNNGLQQKGFLNMTKSWFSDTSYRGVANREGDGVTTGCVKSAIPENKANFDALYSVWPKGNGDNHVQMFRRMANPVEASRTKAAVVWGQNPAVTEPNQSKVREGLKNLDLLVVTDLFETETAACDRKDGAFTYLIPTCAHPEEAGSVTNSARVLQWRYQAVAPRGKSKPDLELLLRFAHALEAADAFSHIKTMWGTLTQADGVTPLGLSWTDAYAKLYGEQYGWTPGGAYDSEATAKKVFKQMCAPQATGGTIWIYLDAWNDGTLTGTSRGFVTTGAAGSATDNVLVDPAINYFGVSTEGIRAKARSRADSAGYLLYPNWGYAWLVNRRVLYNNGDVGADQADTCQGPELVSRLFVSTYGGVVDYGQSYRTVHKLNDKPLGSDGKIPAFHYLPGRFPAHCEPYETPRADWETYGRNSTTDTGINPAGFMNLVMPDTLVGSVDKYPLTLTTIRCVSHFQGGPTTRNNWWNVEVEPEPWIELNNLDARAAGIKDGDYVKVVTARTEIYETPDKTGSIEDTFSRALYGSGFRARVGVGLKENQRVAKGVVAIPWHWGDRGLSTGSRANDLTIDAMDANTTIPEYKVCLCRIEKINQ